MWLNHFPIFVFLLLSTIVECGNVENQFEGNAIGILDNLIIKILESLKPGLIKLHLKNQTFNTGPQEFGNFNGNFTDVIMEGLEKFTVKVINTTFLDLNNLTIELNFSAKGHYHLNGTLAFPLGKNDIHLFGGGEFRAKIRNFTISIKMKIRFDNHTNIVRDFDIVAELDKIQVYFKNLMGGGDLEQVFNQLVNDVGLTVFNYYKEPLLNIIKPKIIQTVTDLLNKKVENNSMKTEL